ARDLRVAAIVTLTESGATARAVARHRPRVPIVGVAGDAATARRLALVWGVTPLVSDSRGSVDERFAGAVALVRDAGLAAPGDLVALTAGLAPGVAGATDTLQVRRVP
ncbi:MAG: pyruvate kinase, partial [Actinobacteria bacterium]